MEHQSFYRAADLVGAYREVKGDKQPKGKKAKGKKARRPKVRIKGKLPFSPAVLWRKVKDGTFPAPVKLSEGITAWPSAAVDKWIAEHSGEKANAA